MYGIYLVSFSKSHLLWYKLFVQNLTLQKLFYYCILSITFVSHLSIEIRSTYRRYAIYIKDNWTIKTVVQCRKTQRFVSNYGV